jgi:hypothetical protein
MLPRQYAITYRRTTPSGVKLEELILAAYELGEAERQFDYMLNRGYLPGLGAEWEADKAFRGIETIEPAPAMRVDAGSGAPDNLADAWELGMQQREPATGDTSYTRPVVDAALVKAWSPGDDAEAAPEEPAGDL